AGGRLTAYAAIHVATSLGMPDFLIGLTIISFGTTLPELITGILATRRGEGDIAIGNVVGSNIFNLLFIGGLVALLHPIEVPPGGLADLLMLTFLSAQECQHEEVGQAAGRNFDGMEESDQAADEQQVKDIAPDDIPDGNVAFATTGGENACDEFGQGGAEGDDGEADEEVWHAQ